jgi:hypothetical protein
MNTRITIFYPIPVVLFHPIRMLKLVTGNILRYMTLTLNKHLVALRANSEEMKNSLCYTDGFYLGILLAILSNTGRVQSSLPLSYRMQLHFGALGGTQY